MGKMKELQIDKEIRKRAVLQLRKEGYDAFEVYESVRIRAWNKDKSEAYQFPIDKRHVEFLANKYEA
jgi:hypothetical protein